MSYFEKMISNEKDKDMDFNEEKDRFFDAIKSSGFDIKDIDENTKLPKFVLMLLNNDLNVFNKFNIMILDFHETNRFNIVDSVIFLINDFLDDNTIVKCLDEMNYIILRKELEKKSKKPIKKELLK